MSKKRIIEIISAIFIFLFVYTASDKIVNWKDFQNSLEETPFIRNYSWLLAPLVPVAELATSALLLVPVARITGLYVSGILMLSFTIYVAWMLAFVPKLPCNCGGIISSLSWKQHLWLNTGLSVLALAAIFIYKNKTGRSRVLLLQQTQKSLIVPKP